MQALFTFDFIESVIEKAKQKSVNQLVSMKSDTEKSLLKKWRQNQS
jgi:hypothetical protein